MRSKVLEKRALLKLKQEEKERKANLARIARYSQEKASEGAYYGEVFKAFRGKMGED